MRSETTNSGCTSLSRPIHAKKDCCSMSRPLLNMSATRWRSTARYCRIGNEAVRLKLIRSPEGMIVETKFVGLPRHFAWQNTEFTIAATIKSLQEMAGREFRPVKVTFTLARNSELPEFERFFGCPVEFSASADRFTLSNETLAIPLVTEDQHLLEALRPICEQAAKERDTVHGDTAGSQSKMKCRSCCIMARPTGKEWRRHWG